VWVNGQQIEFPQSDRQKQNGIYEGPVPPISILSGKNVVAVAVHPPVSFGSMVLSLRLDMPDQVSESPWANHLGVAAERAVVCDMCSSLPGGKPACVVECPHDAAMRIDAQHDFP
jgi:Fe-S-cluster-containing hydrogenase component 2